MLIVVTFFKNARKKMRKIFLIILTFILSLQISNAQWTRISTGVTQDFNDVFSLPNSSTVFACGNSGKIVVSYNSGTNWQILNSGTSENLYSIAFMDGLYGWAAGSTGKIIRTTNGGMNWTSQSGNGTTYNAMYSWINTNPGRWAVIVGDVLNGFNPVIKRTTNGGSSWEGISNNYSEDIKDVKFFDTETNNGIGFAVGGGTNCLILKTVYGGLNWTQDPIVTPGKLYSVFFINQNTGFTVGNNGKYLKTTDGGDNWVVSTLGSGDLRSIYFPDSLNGWIVGLAGRVYNTTNGGNNWTIQPNMGGNHMSVHFANIQTGWIATNLGDIYQTTNGGNTIGVHQLSNEIPTNYLVSQNHPNPFNPKTNINFDITEKDNVKLTIFDVLGREITILVNQQLQPGSYKVDWDASNYPSGVYFYKLEAGEFIQSKKMILIK
jgi:photosystem II stability/assembly factor-like uncharacterized protein